MIDDRTPTVTCNALVTYILILSRHGTLGTKRQITATNMSLINVCMQTYIFAERFSARRQKRENNADKASFYVSFRHSLMLEQQQI